MAAYGKGGILIDGMLGQKHFTGLEVTLAQYL